MQVAGGRGKMRSPAGKRARQEATVEEGALRALKPQVDLGDQTPEQRQWARGRSPGRRDRPLTAGRGRC